MIKILKTQEVRAFAQKNLRPTLNSKTIINFIYQSDDDFVFGMMRSKGIGHRFAMGQVISRTNRV